MVTCSFDLNLCHMNNFISCVRRINGRPVQRSTTRCHVHDKQAEAVISNFSPIHTTKNISKHFRLKPRYHWSKKCICFFIKLVEWPKLPVKKCRNLTLKVILFKHRNHLNLPEFFSINLREYLIVILQVWWKKCTFCDQWNLGINLKCFLWNRWKNCNRSWLVSGQANVKPHKFELH